MIILFCNNYILYFIPVRCCLTKVISLLCTSWLVHTWSLCCSNFCVSSSCSSTLGCLKEWHVWVGGNDWKLLTDLLQWDLFLLFCYFYLSNLNCVSFFWAGANFSVTTNSGSSSVAWKCVRRVVTTGRIFAIAWWSTPLSVIACADFCISLRYKLRTFIFACNAIVDYNMNVMVLASIKYLHCLVLS